MRILPAIPAALILMVATVLPALCAPIGVLQSASVREDGRLRWSSYATTTGTPIPDGTSFSTTSTAGVTFTASGGGESPLTIQNSGGFFTPGVLLRSSGPGAVTLTASRNLQAFGVIVESALGGQASYSLEFFDSSGTSLGLISAPSPGTSGNPQFIGMVDPQARIRSIRATASSSSNLALGEPIFTLPVSFEDDLERLPVATQFNLQLSASATYLHQGLNPAIPTPATPDATDETLPGYNQNAVDLLEKFPTYLPGDILRFERQGIALSGGTSINSLCGVFTRTPDIADGRTLRRLSTPIPAGVGVYTPYIHSFGSPFPTPTNIPEDFQIGTSTFVSIPTGARYLIHTFASPGTSGPVKLLISHIQRQPFLAWTASLGLYGSLADPAGDLDGDGLTLLQEFAFRKDPTTSDAATTDYAFAPRADHTPGGGLLLIYGARMNAGLTYRAEYSSNLTDWTPADESLTAPALIGPEGDRAVFTAIDPAGGGQPRRFGRVTITSLPPR